MIRQQVSLLRFLFPSVLILAGLPTSSHAGNDLQILWIGNSYTYYHKLPKMVADLAKAGGQRPVTHEQQTPGGCTLEKHWKDGIALKKIMARKWDFVVLQEHSLRPVRERELLNEYARKFDTEIRKQGSKTVLYLTWAYQHTPETQGPITRAHFDLAAELKAAVAPVGVAWEQVQAADKRRLLFEADKVHPNQAGSYLAACVFYATLFGKSPEGLPGQIGGMSDADARPLQAMAWKVARDSSKNPLRPTVGEGPWVRGEPFDIGREIKLARPEDKEDIKSTPAPADALVLFNGKDLGGWVMTDGKTKAHWSVQPGGILQVEKGGNIITEKTFAGSFRLHVEFRVPYLPDARGQQRGNSGVYVQGRYEVQILDSYGLQIKMDDCGAIYSIAAPRVNACKAPTVWQSYDIEFRSPQCKDGKKIEPGTMTMFHNGALIHDRVKLTKDNTIAGLGGDPCQPGPIMLQDHGSPVQFRNIWLLARR